MNKFRRDLSDYFKCSIAGRIKIPSYTEDSKGCFHQIQE